jgi:hypothetical protein
MTTNRFAVVTTPKRGGNSSEQLRCWIGVKLSVPAEWAPLSSTLGGDSRNTPLTIPGEVALKALGAWVGTGSPLYQHWQTALSEGTVGITLQPGEYRIVTEEE